MQQVKLVLKDQTPDEFIKWLDSMCWNIEGETTTYASPQYTLCCCCGNTRVNRKGFIGTNNCKEYDISGWLKQYGCDPIHKWSGIWFAHGHTFNQLMTIISKVRKESELPEAKFEHYALEIDGETHTFAWVDQ